MFGVQHQEGRDQGDYTVGSQQGCAQREVLGDA